MIRILVLQHIVMVLLFDTHAMCMSFVAEVCNV